MRNLLMIMYYFPPLGGIGTLRTFGHVRHLSDFGWRPRILTVQAGAVGDVLEHSLLGKVPESVLVSRTRFFDVNRLANLCYRLPFRTVSERIGQFWAGFPPDRHVGWLPFSYHRAKQIIAQEKVDAIFTQSAPYTCHLIGYLLKRATGLPWVADFGDEWTKNPFRSYKWRWQKRMDAWLEQRVLDTADHIIVAWPGMVDLLSPAIGVKATTITCSYDRDDFQGPISKQSDKFRITYTGSFYAAQQPGHFLTAMLRLLEEGRIPVEEVELVFVGRTRTAGFAGFEGTILDNVIKRVGFVSRDEALQFMRSTDVLLLIVSSERGKEDIPGKTFEYLATGNPILGLVPPDGAAADLIHRTGTGVVVGPENVEGICDSILKLYEGWRRREKVIDPQWDQIRLHEAAQLANTLCQVLDLVAS